MANANGDRKKPRIRKSAPTVREMAEKAQTQVQKPKKQLRIAVGRTAKRQFSRISGSDNKVARIVRKIFRPVLRLLGWLVPRYFINSWHELKQVTWPGRRETWRLTGAVFVFAIVFGLMITGVDKVIDKIFKELVIK